MDSKDSQNYDHEIIDNGRTMGWKYELKFNIPQQFHLKIKKAKSDKKKWLELKTVLHMPSGDSTEVIIKGNSEEEVVATKQRIVKLIQPSQKLTHFLSIPLTNDDIITNVSQFKTDVINEVGLHKSLLQKPEKFHLTLVMLALKDAEDEAKAVECLKTCKETIIDPILDGKPLTISLSGIDVFIDADPAATHVLFGKVVSDDLQQIANKVSKYFTDQGLGKPYRSPNLQKQEDVQLHATLINSQFYEDDDVEKMQTRKYSQRKPFDATGVLEKFKDYKFGTLTVNEIRISRLEGEKDPDGYYSSVDVLKF